jgi:protein DGCR14
METPKTTKALIKKRKLELATSSMPPPPPPKRIKRPTTVLDEDTYLSGLSHIIARDYFPGLLETEAKQELLDAIDSKDSAWIASAETHLRNVVNTPVSARLRATALDQTPRDFLGETPAQTPRGKTGDEKPKVDVNMSLGAYQAKYTSEDNESFNALLDKQNEKNRMTHAYHWHGNKLPSDRLLTAGAHTEPKQIQHADSSGSELILRTPNDERAARLIHQTTTIPRNSLMFPPDSVEDEMETVQQARETRSLMPKKRIITANTRLNDDEGKKPEWMGKVPQSPSLSAINAAVTGHQYDGYAESSALGSETPRIAGYKFVDAEPTEEELRAMSVPDSAAILSRLTRGSTLGADETPFSIKEAGDREKLHHKLVDKTKTKGRLAELSSSVFGKTPTPRFKSAPQAKGQGSLTPAGEKLLGKMKTRSDSNREKIRDFDLTPASKRRAALLPGLTPKR